MARDNMTRATSTGLRNNYNQVCFAKGCTNIVRFACDDNLCLPCATKRRKGQVIEIQPRRKKL